MQVNDNPTKDASLYNTPAFKSSIHSHILLYKMAALLAENQHEISLLAKASTKYRFHARASPITERPQTTYYVTTCGVHLPKTQVLPIFRHGRMVSLCTCDMKIWKSQRII